MRRNRKKNVMTKGNLGGVAGIIVLIVALLLTFWLLDSRYDSLRNDIKRCEQELSSLREQELREEVHWNESSTREKLEQAMLQHGIEMEHPTAAQLIRMDREGQPIAGQLALQRLEKGWSGGTAVLNK